MGNDEIKMILRLIDEATKPLKDAVKEVDALNGAAGRASRGGMAEFNKGMKESIDASNALAAGMGVVGAGILALVGTGVKLAADQEQAMIAFTSMLGSAEEAKTFLEGLADFAANTPFELAGLRDSSRMLLAFGFQAKEIIPIMTNVGDAVAALGGGEFEIQRVVRALGQMQAKGKVSAEEMMQLAELGIPVWELLANEIGVSIPEAMKMAEKGVITGVEGIDAIVEGLGERFGGMMEQQSQSLSGLFSTLKDEGSLTLMSIGQDFVEAFNVDDLLRDAIEAVRSIREAVQSQGLVGLLEEHKGIIILVAGAITGALIPAFYGMVVAAGAAALALAPFLIGGVVIGGIIALQTEMAKHSSWDTFVANANRSKEAIEGLTSATTEQGLIAAAQQLSSTLKGEAKQGFDQFFDDTIRNVLAQEGLQAALQLTKKYSAEMLAQANADAAKAQNGILTAEIALAQSQLNSAKRLNMLIDNSANIVKYEGKIADLREQQLATIPIIAAWADTNADLESGLIDSGTATQRWIDSLVNFRATALSTTPTIEELPFLESGEEAAEAATQVNNLGSSVAKAAKEVRTANDVLEDYWEGLDKINRIQTERGDAYDGLIAQLQLEKQIYQQLIDMNAPAELTQQFADSIARLEGMTKDFDLQLEPTITVTFPDPEEYVFPIQLQIESLTTQAELDAQMEAIKADTLAAMRENGIWHITDSRPADDYVFPIQLKIESLTTQAELDAQMAAIKADTLTAMRENGIWAITDSRPDETYVFPIQLEVEPLTTPDDLKAQMEAISADTEQAMQDAGLYQSIPIPTITVESAIVIPEPEVTTQYINGLGEITDKMNGMGEASQNVVDVLSDISRIGHAIGNVVGGEFGKVAKQIAEAADAGISLVTALSKGDWIGAIASGIRLLGTVLGDLKSNVKEFTAEMMGSYDLLGEATTKGILNDAKEVVSAGGILGIFGVKKEQINEEAAKAGMEIANALAQGMKDGLTGSPEDFEKWVNEYIDDMVIQTVIAAQDFSKVVEFIKESMSASDDTPGYLDEKERGEVQGMLGTIRENVMSTLSSMGVTFEQDLPETESPADAAKTIGEEVGTQMEIQFGNIPQAVQFALATPLIEAANNMLIAANLIKDTFSGGRLSMPNAQITGPAGLTVLDAAITRADIMYTRVEGFYNKLMQNGIMVKTEHTIKSGGRSTVSRTAVAR